MAIISKPFTFTHGPVTTFATLVYVAIIVVLIVIHTIVPSAPQSPTPIPGTNLTEAWLDLQLLSANYHPYNSHENDNVHGWLRSRINAILSENHNISDDLTISSTPTYVFHDTYCNITSSTGSVSTLNSGITTYFESTNIIVYIRGEEDDREEWWTDPDGFPSAQNGVLVNAHYDSVSSGFGATDDGVGIVSILQLIRYYTTPGNQPKNGLVLLLNNGEEDFLNGAKVFSQHPLSKLPSTFLNLEGAGAGGRATLFRTTGLGVTKAYSKSRHPFGTVISADGFKRGFIKSQTDYVVFNGDMGMEGLDLAFYEPRARYHTAEDSTRHTNRNAIWHMLEAAIKTTKTLTASSHAADPDESAGVWFDMFGQVFVVLRLRTLFALSITLVVAAPLIITLTVIALYRVDKLYLFAGTRQFRLGGSEKSVAMYGWRGFFRYPLLLLFSCAVPMALAYLLFKENPLIAHSSEWAVWSMMVSSFVFVAWFISKVADYARPSSLTRAYGLNWFFFAWWIVLVIGTVFEEHLHIAGAYLFLFYFASVFLATWLSYLEMFSLPKKSEYCLAKLDEADRGSRSRSTSWHGEYPSATVGSSAGHDQTDEAEETEPTERSGLLGGRGRSSLRKYRHTDDDHDQSQEDTMAEKVHNTEEQEWSKNQWTWLWLLQFILLAPINLILMGQVALLIVGSLHQTGSDGSSMFIVYLATAVFTILLFSPLVPFLHRFTWHVPTLLFFVLVGTLVYSLTAFPFSPNNKLKLFFQQELDLDTNINTVSLVGVAPYVEDAISYLPSAAGQFVNCTTPDSIKPRQKCSWHGIPPAVVPHNPDSTTDNYWVNYTLGRPGRGDFARFKVFGQNTRACKLVFDLPILDVHIHNASEADPRFPRIPDGGSTEIRLWSRTWEKEWTVDVKWAADQPQNTGKVVCLWSDVNEKHVIPAYDEAMHFVPEWVALTKFGDGLVEAYREFAIDFDAQISSDDEEF